MNIIAHKNIFLAAGMSIIVAALVVLAVFGLRLGIDFTGGSLTEVLYENPPTKTKVVETLQNVDAVPLSDLSVRSTAGVTGTNRVGFVVRTRDLAEVERQAVSDALVSLGTNGEIVRFTSIGPSIGQELADKAVWAIGGIALIIVLYVAIAFSGVQHPVRSWVYGAITIVALLHDVLVPTAVMALLGVFAGVEVDVLFVTAILAVLGYSVNDTIVVFDRVRENLTKYRNEHVQEYTDVTGVTQKETTYTLTKPFAEIVNESVLQIITRSINTSLTTLLALGALYVFGGATTQTFALILMVGVLAGTYSSILLANPLLVWYAERVVKLDTAAAEAAPDNVEGTSSTT
jgi:preprotein translocase subunit SecF